MRIFLATSATALMLGATVYAEDYSSKKTDTSSSDASSSTAETISDKLDRPMLRAPQVARPGYAPTGADDLTADDLTGATVYGVNDEDVGEIRELLLADDGTLEQAVIDVGGFLGIGERPVAVTFDELQIMQAGNGTNVRVYIDSTESALEQLPRYDG